MIDRRSFGRIVGSGTAGLVLAGLSTACSTSPSAASKAAPAAPAGGKESPGGGASFGPLKQIDAGVLNVGYAEAGPADGPAVVLLHGWPYDIHSYVGVAPLLAAKGYRVVVPYLRGHGTTRFLDPSTPRAPQQSAFALDIVALMDALGIKRAILGGYDWGSRTADIIAALWPERVKGLVSVTGYLITNRKANQQPLPPKSEWAWWYQYYFSTERGRLGLERNRRDLARLVWTFNSPTWAFDNATFERTAAAFDNPDYVAMVIGNYRWRLGLVDGDPRYDALEARLARAPVITVPTVTLDGAVDPFTPPGDGSSYRAKFTGPYAHRTLDGIGHNVPQEAPAAFAQAVRDVDRM
ncbi:alpha/beta hydrolase [Streptomyces sp. MI02-7b]|uniref:alpha/beta fold hydrolase n=1 Tax=Streptomyces sp. MI02-7b TaxID=462941 RepID=UPI0029BB6F8F|nr:alpha/beta hydrolase [Streptomyces sp. MI02-7b]MDX3070870.1 alpha/beta hydrolase [Streptomyces sp. MI02-7b]